MRWMWKRLRKNQKGAAMIETALIFPIFVFMTLALFEVAIIFFYSFVLESAMYNVTRFAKVQTDPSSVVQEVRNQIQQLSLGLMDPRQVIITTDLNLAMADDWENAEPEQCTDSSTTPATIIPGQSCANTNECSGSWNDVNNDGVCNIGNPPLSLGNAGDLVAYRAFYKKQLYTPGLGLLQRQGGGNNPFASNPGAGLAGDYHLITSTTVSRNEPEG